MTTDTWVDTLEATRAAIEARQPQRPGHNGHDRLRKGSSPGSQPTSREPPSRGESAFDLVHRDMPAIKTYCAPWITEGLTILAGRPKIGKSTLVRQAAAALGEGSAFLGSQCEKTEVLLISLEEGERLFRAKLQKAGFLDDALRAMHLKFTWERGALGAEQLDEYLDAFPGVGVVIVDSLSKFRPLPDAKMPAFQADYAAVSLLHEVVKATPGLAALLVHHTRKTRSDDPIDDISGTYGLTAACDTYMVMRHHAEGVAFHVGGRYWDRDESEFGLVRSNQRWQLTAAFGSLTASQRETLDTLHRMAGATPSELGRALGCKRQSAYDRLQSLVAAGGARIEKGVYVPLNNN